MSGSAQSGQAREDDRLSPVLRPVRAGSGFEEALEQILQVLRLGLVPYGERLPSERELADRLRISRVTLREVLKVLQEQGLVESRRGRYGGTFVRYRAGDLAPTPSGGTSQVTDIDVDDALRFREVLEVGAAELCAARELDGEQRERLRACLAATKDAPLGDYRRLDTRLHLTLAELSGSPSLAAAYAGTRARVNDLLDRIPLLVRNLEHSQTQHAALLDAILEGDVDGAREVMREHCAGTAALLRGFLT
ncbi:FadR/GntR family transcriptional regulator [Streptomyces sp. RPT161]|uniref:FadR/GntR family transcriptional regulator n=1 Tax=Streptomyces sp. RPT161 TaxID=3015993 RepID=UPI0022B894F9|nr:FCD domain-containing protein [Streptomyces sp. RPT161]